MPSTNRPHRFSSLKIVLTLIAGLTTLAAIGVTFGPFLLFLFVFILEPSTTIVERSYQVDRYQVHEKIAETGSSWPDRKYERVYTLQTEHKSLELGRFTNEDRVGIELAPPKIVGDLLVVFSANKVFLWKPDSKPIEFYPFMAKNWMEYSNQGINGFYDYHATDFSIQGNRWIFEYRCANRPCNTMKDNKPMPEKIRFFSDDMGKTFDVLVKG